MKKGKDKKSHITKELIQQYGSLNSNPLLHTEQLKKKYSKVERLIKWKLTQIFLLCSIWEDDSTCRWLSITPEFRIRELEYPENPKFLSNPSTIKNDTISLSREKVEKELFKAIDESIQDHPIAEKYKHGVSKFLDSMKRKYFESLIKNHRWPKVKSYFKQTMKFWIEKRNIVQQIAKILAMKFWEEAFNTVNEKTVLSQKSIDYIFALFYNANKVRKSWWKNIDQVFHDSDCPFIIDNIKANESNYIEAIRYLMKKNRKNRFWRRGREWQKERAKKRSQYVDILRALTNKQLMMDKIQFPDKNNPDFSRDEITQNLYNTWWWLLNTEVNNHNNSKPKKNKSTFHPRLKEIESCVSKIIEGKKINDSIWFRVSTRWINNSIYWDVKKITFEWLQRFKWSLSEEPRKYMPWYDKENWETISIKKVSIDNKWVLEEKQVNDLIRYLNDKVNKNGWNIEFSKRVRPGSPYIEQDAWEDRMREQYPETVDDEEMRSTLKEFYKKIRECVSRWKNWWYKDFKYNITVEIKDKNGTTSERIIELQFDDINNGKGLSNFNIRNFERWLNRQSRLSFSVTLGDARKECEKSLKEMWKWIKLNIPEEEQKEFFQIEFKDTPDKDSKETIDISDFEMRTDNNSERLNRAIINTINYFIKKWTFVLCDNGKSQNNRKPNKLLTVKDLDDENLMENLHICSIFELASQQHSYLHSERNRKVWIYVKDENKIKRVELWKLINPMNLWKKKDPRYSTIS